MSQDRTSITLDPLTHHTLIVAAKSMNVSLSEYVIRALQDHAVEFNKRRFSGGEHGQVKGPKTGEPSLKPKSQQLAQTARPSPSSKEPDRGK